MKRAGGAAFHMVHFEHPPKNIKTVTEALSFFVQPSGALVVDAAHATDEEGVFKLCTLDYDHVNKGDRALILELRCAYVHNEFEESFFWDVEDMFEATTQSESAKHPDVTGKTCVVIPGARYVGPIPECNRVVYKPRLKHLDINLLPYVGLETHILNGNSTCISSEGTRYEYHAYNTTDPFMVFLLQHKHRFDEVNASDIKMVRSVDPPAGGGGVHHTYYLVKRPLVKRVQSFFKTLYSFILYTKRPELRFRWRFPPPPAAGEENRGGRFITVIIQVDYLVLSPEVLKYKSSSEPLSIYFFLDVYPK